jgi:peptide/nickel transport system permease protein
MFITLTPPKPTIGRFRRRLLRMPVRVRFSMLAIVVILAMCALADPLSRFEPNRNSLVNRLRPPAVISGNWTYVLGTDALGRDIFSRLLHGGQVSIVIAGVSTLLGLAFGVALGVLSGYLRGWFDQVVMYLVDVQLSLPFLLLAIVAAIALGSSMTLLIFLAAFSTWPLYARVCRGMALSLRELDFVTAARMVGASDWRIMFRHLLPNLTTPVLVLATISAGRVILLESGLSFLGIGVLPPNPSWGNMIDEGREYLATSWWVTVIPGLALLILTVAVGTLGDWLRDVTDSKVA